MYKIKGFGHLLRKGFYMKKKLTSYLILIVLLITMLSGCNNTKIKESKTPVKPQTTGNTTIVTKKAEGVKPEVPENKVTVTKQTPEVKAKTIVIDPGHGNKSNLEKEPISPGSNVLKIKDGGGAQGVITKTPEYEINLKVALKLKDILLSRGYLVVMTKTEVSENPGNIERAEVGNKALADLVLRIHADSSENESAMGASMLIPSPINNETKKIYSQSKRCGNIIISRVTSEVGMKNRGIVERDDLTGFNWSNVPVILIEMGFLSNKSEDKLLSTNDYESKIAVALADGIDNCFK